MKRALSAAATTCAVAAAATVLAVSPAQADPPGRCGAGDRDVQMTVESAEVNPVLTHLMTLNIADGTTGQRTYTLTRVNSVSTTFNASVEINAEAGKLFAKVGMKVGFSVQTTKSSTDTETNTMTWNFTKPGYYGLYKGTRQVTGTFQKWICRRVFDQSGATWLQWTKTGPIGTFTTFANMEEGTVNCPDVYPAGTLRALAQRSLAC